MTIRHDPQSICLRDLDLRTPQFRRNPELEVLLEELSGYLGPVEASIEEAFDRPALPPLFLVGSPRSGTSLFMHCLSLSNAFAVPTNLLSRFYYAPLIGAKIQELLTNPRFDFRNELANESKCSELVSSLGRTQGKLAPSEFLHFWRRFLPRYDPQHLSEEECKEVDVTGLRKGVAAIESVFRKPFCAKAFMLQYNIDRLIDVFPNAVVLHLRREPRFVMQSILLARKTHYGDTSIWWSVKPKEYEELKEMDIYHQIAGQVYFTEAALEVQLRHVSKAHKLTVAYEAFCSRPKNVADAIQEKYSGLGCELTVRFDAMGELVPRNRIKIDKRDAQKLNEAYDSFRSLTGSLT